MEGITILEEQILYRPNLFVLYLLISGFICIIIWAYTLVFDIFDKKTNLIFFGIGILGMLLSLPMSAILQSTPTNEAIYTVRIEEKIDLNEFLNNYEIVEHEKYSNIYKIKGKRIMVEE